MTHVSCVVQGLTPQALTFLQQQMLGQYALINGLVAAEPQRTQAVPPVLPIQPDMVYTFLLNIQLFKHIPFLLNIQLFNALLLNYIAANQIFFHFVPEKISSFFFALLCSNVGTVSSFLIFLLSRMTRYFSGDNGKKFKDYFYKFYFFVGTRSGYQNIYFAALNFFEQKLSVITI